MTSPEAFVARCTRADQHLSGPQADEILRMQLQRLTGLEMEKLAKEYVGLCEEIAGYEAILGDEQRVADIIREDLAELKEKYANPRRTEITEAAADFQIEELIPNEQVIVTVSHEGYVKREPLTVTNLHLVVSNDGASHAIEAALEIPGDRNGAIRARVTLDGDPTSSNWSGDIAIDVDQLNLATLESWSEQ